MVFGCIRDPGRNFFFWQKLANLIMKMRVDDLKHVLYTDPTPFPI